MGRRAETHGADDISRDGIAADEVELRDIADEAEPQDDVDATDLRDDADTADLRDDTDAADEAVPEDIADTDESSIERMLDEEEDRLLKRIEGTDELGAHGRPRRLSRRMNRVMVILFSLSAVFTGVLLAFYLLVFVSSAQLSDGASITFFSVYMGLLVCDAIGCMSLVVYDFNTHLEQSRKMARATEATLLLTVVVGIVVSGLSLLDLVFLFQFVCVIFFQLYTDEALARNERFHAPWEISTDTKRRGYIPLNFFNLFWVFVIACIVGLVIEEVWHVITVGGYQDRAGLLWGPFSPIYGFGAALMTVALNRFWNRNFVIIFLVSGLIGAAFEFCTSYFMETAFGIIAWDYSGTFLNIQGRTNFMFFCAWGVLGLLWIKGILPLILKAVDAVPLKIRATVTVLFALFMLFDGFMTLVTIDCWYEREAGSTPDNIITTYCAEHFDDSYMQNRFQTMDMDVDKSARADS